jgi:hypothetical protein
VKVVMNARLRVRVMTNLKIDVSVNSKVMRREVTLELGIAAQMEEKAKSKMEVTLEQKKNKKGGSPSR